MCDTGRPPLATGTQDPCVCVLRSDFRTTRKNLGGVFSARGDGMWAARRPRTRTHATLACTSWLVGRLVTSKDLICMTCSREKGEGKDADCTVVSY